VSVGEKRGVGEFETAQLPMDGVGDPGIGMPDTGHRCTPTHIQVLASLRVGDVQAVGARHFGVLVLRIAIENR
jgi:hypothetical protein